MPNGDMALVMQVLKTMEDAAHRLEDAYQKKDAVQLESIKKELLALNTALERLL